MSKKRLRAMLCGVLVAASFGLAPSARANHHFMQITEVFMGTGGAGNAIFVELTTLNSGQQFVSGQKIVFYDAVGNGVESATFTTNPPDASEAGAHILVASPDAETLFGATADLEFDPTGISEAGGKVCFESTTFGVIDCVSWGNYTGDSAETGDPFGPAEGIPSGASILRNDLRGNPDAYDGADDSDDSKRDFFMSSPFPGGSNPAPTATPARIQFSTDSFVVPETDPSESVLITRSGSTALIQVITFTSLSGSATKGSDFLHPDTPVQFSAGDTQETRTVTIDDDIVFEGAEKAKLRLRNPTNQAVLGFAVNATMTIEDPEDDNQAPKSRITKPEHGGSYDRANLTKFKGTANDGPGTVEEVAVALRRNMTDGSCQQFNGFVWVVAACNAYSFGKANGTTSWVFPIDPLKKSVGTDVKSYTALSRAQDGQTNTETFFKKGRNKNTFEVK
jgi:Calx-beta domain